MSRPPRRPGRLSPEDEALWHEVTRRATPLGPARGKRGKDKAAGPPRDTAADAAAPSEVPTARQDAAREVARGAARDAPRRTVAAGGAAPGDPAPVARRVAGLDRRTAERLRRGLRRPEVRIDLHGMTAERAHQALDRCIARALAEGGRLILVITGKGGGRRGAEDPPHPREDRGVLRRQVPEWLRTGPHARHIVGIYQAHQRHGGAGAFYVYLRKRR